MHAKAPPILYTFRRCPYAMRARLALEANGCEVEMREIALKNKPAAFLKASPKGTVPVLVLPNGQVLEQSLAIMEWALDTATAHPWLTTRKGSNGFTNAALVTENDGPFKYHLDRYKYPHRITDTPAHEGAHFHRDAGAIFLHQLERRLQEHPYLSGLHWGFVDAALAPFVRQFAHTDAAWFHQQNWPHLIAWLGLFEASEAFDFIMRKLPLWVEPPPLS